MSLASSKSTTPGSRCLRAISSLIAIVAHPKNRLCERIYSPSHVVTPPTPASSRLGAVVRLCGRWLPIALFQPLDQLALMQFHHFLFVFGFHSPERTAAARLYLQLIMPFNVIWHSSIRYVPPSLLASLDRPQLHGGFCDWSALFWPQDVRYDITG